MPYNPTTYTTSGTVTSANLNNGETQYSEATQSLEQDLFTPFVLSGLVATKDGVTASQLDVTAGVAFPVQTDGTLRRRAPVASTQSTVGHASATLYLDLNPDGTWSWGTAHSAVSGHLTIATVTTDASANIATVTDTRVLNTTLLSGLAGIVQAATPIIPTNRNGVTTYVEVYTGSSTPTGDGVTTPATGALWVKA